MNRVTTDFTIILFVFNIFKFALSSQVDSLTKRRRFNLDCTNNVLYIVFIK